MFSIHNWRRNILQIIVSKVAGLGLQLCGCADQQDGPGIFIERVIEGGDCYLVSQEIFLEFTGGIFARKQMAIQANSKMCPSTL